ETAFSAFGTPTDDTGHGSYRFGVAGSGYPHDVTGFAHGYQGVARSQEGNAPGHVQPACDLAADMGVNRRVGRVRFWAPGRGGGCGRIVLGISATGDQTGAQGGRDQ